MISGQMKKLIILEGVNATGKTTIAYRLASLLGGVVIHQPSLTWWGKLCRKYKKQWMFDLDRWVQRQYVKRLDGDIIIYVRSPLSKYVYEEGIKSWKEDWEWLVKDFEWKLIYLYTNSRELIRRIDSRADGRVFTEEQLERYQARYEEILASLPCLKVDNKLEETIKEIVSYLKQS